MIVDRRFWIGHAALAATSVLAACGSSERFTTQALKPGKARVYVYGAPFMFKSIAGFTVKVDGEAAGRVGPEYYASLDLAPGPHTIEIYQSGNLAHMVMGGPKVSLTVAAGATYYVRGVMRPIEGTAAWSMHPTVVTAEAGGREIVTMSPG